MLPARDPTTTRSDSTNPTARIDAQEEDFIAPVRKFFVDYGCSVFLNRGDQLPVDYHIISGDGDFVKKIFQREPLVAKRRMIILSGESDTDFSPPKETPAVIVLHDGDRIDQKQAMDMLQFFFTGTAGIRDLRKNPKRPIAKVPRSVLHEASHVAQLHSWETEERVFDDHERIKKIIAEVFGRQGRSGKASMPRKKRERKPFVFRRRHRVAIGFLVVCFPVLWYTLALTLAALAIAGGGYFLQKGNSVSTVRLMKWGRWWTEQADSTLPLLRVPFVLVGRPSPLRHEEQFVEFLGNVISAQEGVGAAFVTSQHLASDLLARAGEAAGTPAPASQVDKLRTELFAVQNNLSLAQGQLGAIIKERPFLFIFPPLLKGGEKAMDILDRTRKTIATIDNFLLLYPRIAGFRGKQSYLVLLQNSMELRPSGGFIGSVALVTFADGRMTDIEVQDVYTLDGQLRGHVDPPGPVRELLEQEHWYLRDSNWEADFRLSGARAAWFYEKETGIAVDGVIGISQPFIVDLLSVVGPLELPDYQDRITAENFFGKSLYYTQANFFPGSTQKKDFLGSLTTSLLGEVTSGSTKNPAGVFRAATNALVRRDIQFYFQDWELAALVSQFGWDGAVFSAEAACREAACVADPLAIVEANVGVNKANYFVTRSQSYEIAFAEDGSMSNTVSIVWHNTSRGAPTDAGGNYRAYVRFYAPAGARVEGVMLDGVPVTQRDRSSVNVRPALPYVEEAEATPAQVAFGVALEVPAGGEQRLAVSYRPSTRLSWEANSAVYQRLFQRQSGTSPNKLHVLVRYPIFWSLRLDDPVRNELMLEDSEQTVLANQAQLEYNTTLTQDAFIKLRFVKQPGTP